MYGLPTSVTVNDTEYEITEKGDFRMVLDCFQALNDDELSEDEKILACLLIFYNELNDIMDIYSLGKETITELIEECFKFFNCGKTDSPGSNQHRKLIDWEKDEQIIIPAINNVAGKEVRLEPYVHWWTFMGYYMSVGESVLSTVVSIRSKISKGKKLEKWESDFKKSNPEYFIWDRRTQEDKQAEEYIRKLWNEGGENSGE